MFVVRIALPAPFCPSVFRLLFRIFCTGFVLLMAFHMGLAQETGASKTWQLTKMDFSGLQRYKIEAPY